MSNSNDSEPFRCMRNDGKKWRCSRDVLPGKKYCERHLQTRGRKISKKSENSLPTSTNASIATNPSPTHFQILLHVAHRFYNGMEIETLPKDNAE